MSLRAIDVYLPDHHEGPLKDTLADHAEVLDLWSPRLGERTLWTRVLVQAQDAEPILDALERFSSEEGFRVVLLPVEATLPRPEPPPEAEAAPAEEESPAKKRLRISREELYADVAAMIQLNPVFLTMVALSTLVAAIGLIKDNAVVVIGAMVIAPLLGPNVALSLASTLADGKLGRQALRTNLVGVATAFALALGVGAFFGLWAPQLELARIPEIAARTRVDLGDVALALMSGVAGALSLTTGVPTSLIGVMVAVALLPPLAVCAMLLGAGEPALAARALLLLAVNVICVNLAGGGTFLVQGIRPATWWEAARAKRAARVSLLVWGGLLVGLVGLVAYAQYLAPPG